MRQMYSASGQSRTLLSYLNYLCPLMEPGACFSVSQTCAGDGEARTGPFPKGLCSSPHSGTAPTGQKAPTGLKRPKPSSSGTKMTPCPIASSWSPVWHCSPPSARCCPWHHSQRKEQGWPEQGPQVSTPQVLSSLFMSPIGVGGTGPTCMGIEPRPLWCPASTAWALLLPWQAPSYQRIAHLHLGKLGVGALPEPPRHPPEHRSRNQSWGRTTFTAAG